MSLEETLRQIVREELRAALNERPAPSAPDELLTTKQAAEVAKVQPATIRAWARGGELKRYGTAKKARWRRSEVLALKPKPSAAAEGVKATAQRLMGRTH